MTTAMMPPGLTHFTPPCFAFGLAQKSTANSTETRTSSTGHLRTPQTTRAVSPAPMRLPTCSATGPLTTTMTALTTMTTTAKRVTPTRIGTVFQRGRPSGMS